MPSAITLTGNASSITTTGVAGNYAGLYVDGGLLGSGNLTITGNTPGVGVVVRNNNIGTYTGTLTVNGTASTAVGGGSGLAVGNRGTNATMPNGNLTLNGTLEMGNTGMGCAGGSAGAQTFQVNALNGTGDVVANWSTGTTTTLSVGNANGSGTFSGIIANGTNDTMSFVKAGTGVQALTGANLYTGATTISAGTLQIGSGGTSGSLAATSAITDNASLVYNRSDGITVANAISGTGTVTQAGSGVLGISASNSYSGGTTVSTGRILAQNTSAIGTGALTVQNGGAFDFTPGTGTSTLTLGPTSGTALTLANGSAIGAEWGSQIALNTGAAVSTDAAAAINVDLRTSPTISAGTTNIVSAPTTGGFTANGATYSLDVYGSTNLTFALTATNNLLSVTATNATRCRPTHTGMAASPAGLIPGRRPTVCPPAD